MCIILIRKIKTHHNESKVFSNNQSCLHNHIKLFKTIKDDAVKGLHSMCEQVWKTQQWPQDWKRSVFIPILKKGNTKECSNYHTIALISNASKVMLKILQARLQQCMNQRLNCKHPLNHRKISTSASLTMLSL